MQDFEKLGLFYLGRTFDPATRQPGEALTLYDSRDLLTHAVCVGMTGSGKTGLCLSLLEEAAIDQVPAIAIDPKGDLANLLLTFPQLRPDDFAPWVDAGEARRKGLEPAAFAAQQAALWKDGLAQWGQDGARIERLRASAEFRVYTPGSRSGIPISVLKSFAAPSAAVRDDPEVLADRVATTADSLLGLLGVESDAMHGREHILVSNILSTAWSAGEDLSLDLLISAIQDPPFSRVGVIELESFFPAKDRFALAMRLNNLLASPGFASWLEGEPLDVDALLHAPDGKPRVSIISIAHLSEAERMFVVALLLNEVLGWVRTQPGTSSLRALLYMDEIFGYFPPVATPPSKRPLLTLLKQARAYGLGVVLATQNPADLDYKGLSNTGTWFIGRLQAERDKLRVLEGLEGAAAAQSARFDRQAMDTLLSGLAPRTFLLHNVHDDQPDVFQVRWAMSYLRGPLTREQIKRLMDPLRPGPDAAGPAPGPAPATATPTATRAKAEPAASGPRPLLPPDVPQFVLPVRHERPEAATLVYQPMVYGFGEVYYNDTKSKVAATVPVARLAPLTADALTLDWTEAETVELTPDDLEKEPESASRFDPLPAAATKAKSYATWTKAFVDALYRGETLSLLESPSQGVRSNPQESERDFRVRLQQTAREGRDAALDALRARYAPKLSALEQKIRKAEQVVERESAQARNSGLSSLVRIGTTVFGAFVGKKTLSTANINKAGTALRNVGQTMKENTDVSLAEQNAKAFREQYFQIESEFREEARKLERSTEASTEPLKSVELKPKKTNITPKLVALVWAPRWEGEAGATTPAWG